MSSPVRASALSTLAGVALMMLSGAAAAVDEAAALALARKSDCVQCHAEIRNVVQWILSR